MYCRATIGQYALNNARPISIEYSADPHPRNSYWEMFERPMFDIHDAARIISEVERARTERADAY